MAPVSFFKRLILCLVNINGICYIFIGIEIPQWVFSSNCPITPAFDNGLPSNLFGAVIRSIINTIK